MSAPRTERVTSPDDPRLRDYVDLTDVALRRVREPAEGLFIAEGAKVVRRAVDSGHRVRSLLMAPRWLPELADLAAASGAPVYLADEGLLREVTGYSVHRGALASMHRRPLPAPTDLLPGARRVVVLEDVNDHTNVGAIVRSVAALGADAVLLSPGCADPLYRRAVKVSMGAVFAVPHARLADWPGDLDLLRRGGLAVLGLTPDPGAVALADLAPGVLDRCALVLGAEGPGLSAAALAAVDARVRIPMSSGVDSLNVAAAAAVALYAVAQQAASAP